MVKKSPYSVSRGDHGAGVDPDVAEVPPSMWPNRRAGVAQV